MRPMFGGTGKGLRGTSVLFVSEASITEGQVPSYGLDKRIEPVRRCRGIGKADMKLNDALPRITVDPKTYEVKADGAVITCEPASYVPLARRYALF